MAQVTLSEYRDQVAAILQAGQFDHALRATRFLLFHYPQYVEGYRLLGQCLLEAGHLREAALQFLRVLSADPESVAARRGLARAHQLAGDLPQAVAHMQLACDLAPNDPILRQELQQLMLKCYGQAVQPEMTLAGLGRIYAYNGLYAKAIQEFRAVLVEEPARADVQMALAEMLWHECRYFEAAEVCRDILSKLPNVLKANLILGVILLDSDQPDEARPYLKRAQALDPEQTLAQALMGDQSPLMPKVVRIQWPDEADLSSKLVSMSLMPTDGREPMCLEPASDWAQTRYGKETAQMSSAHQPDDELDIPDWLRGVGDDLLAEEGEPSEPSTPGAPAPAEEVPHWLGDMPVSVEAAADEAAPRVSAETAAEVPTAAAPPEPEKMPDWLADILAGEPAAEKPVPAVPGLAPEAERQPAEAEVDFEAWLNQLTQVEVEPEASEGMPSGQAEQAGAPDWATLPTAPLPTETVASADWLHAESTPQAGEQAPTSSLPEADLGVALPVGDEENEMPDWLRQIVEGAPAPTTEVSTEEGLPAPAVGLPEAEVDESALPEWLRDFEVAQPAGRQVEGTPRAELPSWLESLAMDELTAAPPAGVEEAIPAPGEASAQPADLPDWLRDIGVGEAAATPVVPAAAEEEPVVQVSGAAEERVETPVREASVSEADLDWLRQIGAAEAAPAVSTVTPLEEEAVAESVEEAAEVEAFPNWLERLAAAEAAPEVTGVEELPVAEEGPTVMEIELPPAAPAAPQAALATAETPEPETVEIPAWLRELQEGAKAGEEVILPEPEAAYPEWIAPPPPVEAEAPEVIQAEEPVSGPALPQEVMLEPEVPPTAQAIAVGPPEVTEAVPAMPGVEEPPAEAVPEVAVPPQAEQVPELVDERLALARAALTSGSWAEALAAYTVLVNSGELLDKVIADLEEGTRRHPKDVVGFQLLGDAYMKSGRLSAALRAYRTALANLY